MLEANVQIKSTPPDPGRNQPKPIDLQRKMTVWTSRGPPRGRGDKNKIKKNKWDKAPIVTEAQPWRKSRGQRLVDPLLPPQGRTGLVPGVCLAHGESPELQELLF